MWGLPLTFAGTGPAQADVVGRVDATVVARYTVLFRWIVACAEDALSSHVTLRQRQTSHTLTEGASNAAAWEWKR